MTSDPVSEFLKHERSPEEVVQRRDTVRWTPDDVAQFMKEWCLWTDRGFRVILAREEGYTVAEADGMTTGMNGTHHGYFTMTLDDVDAHALAVRVCALAASMPPPRSMDVNTTPEDVTVWMYGGRYTRGGLTSAM